MKKKNKKTTISNKEYLLSIFDLMDDGVYVVNENHEIEYINSVVKDEFGEVNNKKCYEYFQDADSPCPWCKLNIIQKGKRVQWDWQSPKSENYYDIVETPLYNEDGSISKLKILRDITKQKKIESDLWLIKERYRLAQNAANIGSWDWTIGSGELFWSEEIEKIFGLKDVSFSGSIDDFYKYVHPEDLNLVKNAINESIKNKDDYWIEHRIIRPNGSIRWVEETGGVLYNESGTPIRMVGITRDITKDKEWENLQESLIQEIEKERDLLNIIMENSNTNLAYLDKDFNFINVNSFFVQSCGISKDKLIDNNFFDFFPSNENKAIFKKVIQNRKKVEFEAKHFKFQKDKEAKYWNWSLIPISNKKGTIKGLVLSLQDVTDIKKNEQYVKNLNDALMRKTADLAISNQELEAFTYSASHDLQAPLRSISGFSEILLEDYLDSLDEEGKDYLKRIEKATDMMSQLINDLLKLSRVSRSDINRQEVDINKLAYNSLNTLRTKDPLRSVKVEIQSNLKTEGDKNLLQIAIDNLIRNAWKFTKNKKHAKIEIGKTEKNGKQTYYIRDNGIGFDEKFKEKLFIPFQRFHDEKEYPGSGIGLPLVARIIHRHNGEIWAESSPKKGTTFYFTLGK